MFYLCWATSCKTDLTSPPDPPSDTPAMRRRLVIARYLPCQQAYDQD